MVFSNFKIYGFMGNYSVYKEIYFGWERNRNFMLMIL